MRAAASSVVRVLGTACGLAIEGSGWVAEPDIVVTNAHVVAGEQETTVEPGGRPPGLPAQVIAFDPTHDLAVLRVPELDRPTLSLAPEAASGTAGAILGFPENGPFDVQPGRIGRTQTVITQNAYGQGPVSRLLTPLRGLVRPGNSGGPMVDTEGRVLTTIFAGTVGGSTARAATGSPTRPSRPSCTKRTPARVGRRRGHGRLRAGLSSALAPAGRPATLTAMAKTLLIAEKPSVGQDLARVLQGPFEKKEGFLEGPEHVVTWAVGHLVQLAEPEAYDPKYKSWRMADLPIVPERFKLEVRDERSRKQMAVVTKQLGREDIEEVVNACDAGREGELIFAYLYEKAKGKKPVKRLWLNSMTTAAMRSALAALRPAEEFERLEEAARSRSEADWIVGMNATRAATIRLRSSFDGAVSLGRVQTPTLAIVARREEEIRAFKPEPYWLVDATFAAAALEGDGGPRRARLRRPLPGPAPAAPAATKGPRIGTEQEALAIVAACEGRPGTITKLEKKEQREKAPMLYDLTTLQREANNRYGFSAKRTLAAAQRLYEEHKALTYPRTNSRYLTERHGRGDQADRRARGRAPEYRKGAEYVIGLDVLPLARVVNDEKVTDHHAIIPTRSEHNLEKMGADDRRIYDMVARRFLAVFHPEAVFENTRVETTVERGATRRSGRGPRVPHARQAAARARLARRLRRGRRRRRCEAEARGEEDEESRSAAAAAGRRTSRCRRARSRACARKPNRRGATATPRCWARWRRPASSSTTTSCARR